MTHARKRIEIVVEAVRAEQVTDLLDACGASGWTILAVVSGRGRTGLRRGANLAGVFDNVLVLCIASEAVANKVLAARDGLLGARPAIVSVTDRPALRAEHFG